MFPRQDQSAVADDYEDLQNVNFHDVFQLSRAALPPSFVQIPTPRDYTRKEIAAAEDLNKLRKVVDCTNKSSFFSTDDWATIPDFSSDLHGYLLKARSTSADIPPAALPFFAEALVVATDALGRYPGDKSWALFLMVPTLLLWSQRSSTSELSRAKYVANRSIMFVQGRVSALWESVVEQVARYQMRVREDTAKEHTGDGEFHEQRFMHLMANNRSSEALDMVTGNRGVRVSFKDGAIDEATQKLIERKIPQGDPPQWPTGRQALNEQLRKSNIQGITVDAITVVGLYSGEVASKRRGTGASFSGWTFDMFHAALRVPHMAGNILRNYAVGLNFILQGQISDSMAEYMQSSPLVIVEASSTGKRRVVFPQEIFFRDASALGLKWAEKQPNFRKFFHNQYAMGVKNGGLVPSVVLQATMEKHAADASVGIVSRDIENQFHTFSRELLLKRLLECYQVLDLRPLAFMASYLMLATVGYILEAAFSVAMAAGSAQGNALSSLFAQFLFQFAIDALLAHMGDRIIALSAFADNLDAVIRAGYVGEYIAMSEHFLQPTSMRFGLASDTAFFPGLQTEQSQHTVQGHFPPGQVRFANDGLDLDATRIDRCGTIITGIPIGSSAFQTAAVQRIVDKALAAMDALRLNKKVNLVCSTKILQECIIARLSFIGQAISPSITRPLFATFDKRLAESFFEALHMSPLPAQIEQVQLPRSLGGAGLRRMELACIPAYLASQVKARNVANVANPSDLFTQITSYNKLVDEKDKVTSNSAGKAKLASNSMRDLTFAIWKRSSARLSADLSPQDKMRLLIAAKPKTSSWMTSLGSYSAVTRSGTKARCPITDPLFGTLFRNRLITGGGCNFMPPDQALLPFPKVLCHNSNTAEVKVCGKQIDKDFLHPTSGCHFIRYNAHQVGASALEFVARDLGCSVSHATQIPGMKKHADLLIYNLFDDYQATAIDMSVRNPLSLPLAKKKLDPLLHLTKAEKDKRKKYERPYANLDRGFKPFIVSSLGLFSASAKEVINALAKRYAVQYFVPLPTAKRCISDFIGCSILKQVAQNSVGAQSKLRAAVGVTQVVPIGV